MSTRAGLLLWAPSRAAVPLALVRVAAVLLAALAAASQARALDPRVAVSQYLCDTWTAREGAPASTIYQITQTHDGYLWLGTDADGLLRFDGVRFERMRDLDQLFGHGDYAVFSVYTARDGTLWVGTHWGLAAFSGGVWRGPVDRGAIGGIHETETGVLRYALGNWGYGWLEGGKPRRRALGIDCVGAVPGAGDDSWLATRSGLWRVSRSSVAHHTVQEGLAHRIVNALHYGRDGSLWVATRGGVNRVRDGRVVERLSTADGIPSNNTTAIHEDRDGNLWIGTSGAGVCRLRQGRVEVLARRGGVPDGQTTTFFEDREGSLWIGTRAGLARLRVGVFVPYGETEGLPPGRPASIVEGRDGRVWMWIDGGGLVDLRGQRLRVRTRADGLASDFGGPLFEARDGAIWVGHDRGASVIRGDRISALRQGELGSNYVSAFAEDEQGLILSLYRAGLRRMLAGRLTPFRLPNGTALELDMPWAMRRSRDGALWLATSAGVVRVQGNSVRRVWERPGDPLGVAVSIHEDARGTLWIATWDGLLRVADGRATTFTMSNGLFQERIHHVLEDDLGWLWLSSPRGIFRVRKSELDDVALGRAQQVHSEVFGLADGLRTPSAVSSAQPAGCAARDGRLWFVTTAGPVVVVPGRLSRNPLPPPVVIDRVFADGRMLEGRDALAIPRATERVEIHYNGLSLLSPEKVLFRYRLDDFDRDWVDAGTRRVAYYTNVPPGSYVFRVIACNDAGLWNESGAALRLTQSPRWHQTWAFRLLLAFAALAVVSLTFRWRVGMLKRRERVLHQRVAERTLDLQREIDDHQKTEAKLAEALERVAKERARAEEGQRAQSRLFTSISHELRTPLTLVLAPIDELLLDAEPGPLRSTLEGVQRNALRLLRYIDELLELARLDAGHLKLSRTPVDLRALAAAVWESGLPLARARGINLRLDAPPTPTSGLIADAHRIDSILTNLVGNALKHTPAAGRIEISIAETEEAVVVEVSDTGPGIPEAERSRIFDRFYQAGPQGSRRGGGFGLGLSLSKELAELHGGTLSVADRPGGGATFSLRLPKGDVRPEGTAAQPALPGLVDGRERFDGLDSVPGAGAAAQAESPLGLGPRPRILIVEDHDEMRAFVRGLLTPGFDVIEAADGNEGLTRAAAEHPDLVVADVMMPGRSGTDLCRAIKEDPRLRSTPVILLTAQSGPDATLDAYGHGADDFVAKPFQPRVLIARVNAQLRLRSLGLQLVAQEKLVAIGTLAAGMAHEVRNPLNAVLNAARVLREGRADARLSDELLAVVSDGARRIDSIVAALDSHARPAEGTAPVACSVAEGLESTLRLLNQRLQGVAVEREYRTDRPAIMPVGALNQVLLNLLDNALRSGARRIRLVLQENEGRLCLRVGDDGPGVSAEIRERIFDPFFSTREPGDGTGLGLFISRKLLRDNGGDLKLASSGEGGATFEVWLPLETGGPEERAGA